MDPKDAKIRAARLCSQQERCTSYIRTKLEQWKVPEKHMASIVHYLREEKYLDDSRYAQFFVKDKFRFNQWGKIKIRHALRQNQIPDNIINEALEQIPEEEYFQTCLSLLQNKNKTIKDTNHLTRKGKLLRFAAQRGFESDLVYKAIHQISINNKK